MTTTKSFVLGVLLLVPVSVWAAGGQQDAGPCRAPGRQCENQRECRRDAGDVGGEQAYRTCLALREKESDDCAAERDRYERCTTSARGAGTGPVDGAAGDRRGKAGHDAGDVTGDVTRDATGDVTGDATGDATGTDDSAGGRSPERNH